MRGALYVLATALVIAVAVQAGVSNLTPTVIAGNRLSNRKAQSKLKTKRLARHSGSSRSAENSKPRKSREALLRELDQNMVWVEGGTFMMGATSEQGSDAEGEEKPAHRVTLNGFYICKYEVTQELWEAVTGFKPGYVAKGPRLPVENITWNDCRKFMMFLILLTGKQYRFPTEAEWEFAARGGVKSRGYKYSGSNNIDDVAWYDGNSGNTLHDVGSKLPNELGLYDMSGSVTEWCEDWYDSRYYRLSPVNNPRNDNYMWTYGTPSPCRVLRGGYWCANAKRCRVSCRDMANPGSVSVSIGLRLALSR